MVQGMHMKSVSPMVKSGTLSGIMRASLAPTTTGHAFAEEGGRKSAGERVLHVGTAGLAKEAEGRSAEPVRKRMLITPKTTDFTSRSASFASSVRSLSPPIKKIPDAAYLVA